MIVIVGAAMVWLGLVVTRRRGAMLAGAAILAGGWLWTAPAPPALSKAAALPQQSGASCARVAEGMSASDVITRAGKPDEVRNDEEARGPGAKILVYRASRCEVHLLDGRVELIE